MKKLLTKISIGTVALAVFIVFGYSTINTGTQVSSSQSKNQSKNMIKRSQTGQFTRGGSAKKGSYNNAQSRYGVIYIGESTEGLLD